MRFNIGQSVNLYIGRGGITHINDCEVIHRYIDADYYDKERQLYIVLLPDGSSALGFYDPQWPNDIISTLSAPFGF